MHVQFSLLSYDVDKMKFPFRFERKKVVRGSMLMASTALDVVLLLTLWQGAVHGVKYPSV